MKKFTRTIEDFSCQHCGLQVVGDGYTNHCPRCLYSKHVDVNPGDRQDLCLGLMEPISAHLDNQEWIITHKCLVCGSMRNNKTSPTDNFDAVVALSAKANPFI